MKYYSSSQSGFSLVETLVAITILLVVIVGPMSISATAARSTSFSSEQVIAFFLAQEGAEIAQKVRDDLILDNFNLPADPSDGWLEFTTGAAYINCFDPDGCGLELNTDAVASLKAPVDCGSASCLLYYNAGGDRSRYTYSSAGAIATPYTRIIYFEPTTSSDEIKVTSKVTWRTGSQRKPQEASVETYLFNVYGN